MKKLAFKFWALSLILLSGCNVVKLNNNSFNSNLNTLAFSNNDTLTFTTSLKHVIDSVLIDDDVYNVGGKLFLFPLNLRPGGLHKIKLNFYLSNRRTKQVEKEILILADTAPKIITIDNYITIPHNTSLFTQGLEFNNGVLFESAGRYGESSVNKINHITGEITAQINVDSNLFAEGLTIIDDTIFVLTWKEGLLLQLDSNLKEIEKKAYSHEGWGLCNDGHSFIASDGSDKIYFMDPQSLEVINQVTVYNHQETVMLLNELEWIDGYLLANVWGKQFMVVFDPESGKVLCQIDFSEIIEKYHLEGKGVLNGLAFDRESNKLYFTGKNWPYYFVSYLPKELQR
ncbi:glutaminyl-peptide cyclotransferase [Carboxylicivirga caseinilyticus]|uniref:glutaminyl-peptide cyclotransferase n=1 Tax=Carboxylicivirga caseinilyticus TaxID=3417572 RepID=UPI003D33247C|nr:glutaminyl-peptide cyclotransferase [Marinilabiliaceae bacterium A049]